MCLWNACAYDVFGQPTIRDVNGTALIASAVDNPYLFTGRRYDAEAGLYYYRARYYDFATARFLQPDPLGYEAGLDLYTYCGNNPIGFVDPFGLDWLDSQANFWAGFGDTVSLGITGKIREWMGTDSAVDRKSGYYKGGVVTGIAHGLVTGGGRLAYAGISKAGSKLLLRHGATPLNAYRALKLRNTLKVVFNLGLYDKAKVLRMANAMWKYKGSYASVIQAAGRTSRFWNRMGAFMFSYGLHGVLSLPDSKTCK